MSLCSCFSLSTYAAGPTVLSAPPFLHMQIVDSSLNFTIIESWFGFLKPGTYFLLGRD